MVSVFVDNIHGVIVRFLLLFFEGFGSLLEPSSGKFFEKAEWWSEIVERGSVIELQCAILQRANMTVVVVGAYFWKSGEQLSVFVYQFGCLDDLLCEGSAPLGSHP
ncbi:hypothetical protein M513_13184 [Trichuris suis]|uniref:Uncharacterized protein n=1 Tax=Trichuris suis TaxID=68888 RepID=A0A085LLV0_9BILA|nr:hypothetical protein M513_13184 [Trichuris suis]